MSLAASIVDSVNQWVRKKLSVDDTTKGLLVKVVGSIPGQVVYNKNMTYVAALPWNGANVTLINLAFTADQLHVIRDLRLRVSMGGAPAVCTVTLINRINATNSTVATFPIGSDFNGQWASLMDMFDLPEVISGAIQLTIERTSGSGANNYDLSYLKGTIT